MGLELNAAARAQEFREANGRVLRLINFIHDDYVSVHDVIVSIQARFPYLTDGVIRDSFNFLLLAEYIELRYIRTEAPITRIAKVNLHELEGILTLKGIRLMSGTIQDADVIV